MAIIIIVFTTICIQLLNIFLQNMISTTYRIKISQTCVHRTQTSLKIPRGQSKTGNRRTYNIKFTMPLCGKKKKRKERPGVKPLLTTDWATRTPLKTGVNSDTPQSSMYENDLMCNKILLCMLQFHSASICSLTWLWNAHYLYCGRCSFYIVDVVHSTFE